MFELHTDIYSTNLTQQAALRVVKDGEDIRKAAKVHSVPFYTLRDYLIREPNTCNIKQMNN